MRLRMRISVNGALCSGQFAMSIMQTVFMFYYVRVFRVIFEIDAYWFTIAQALFMIWNSINDPLFGCMQDLSSSWMRDRRKVITYLSPLLCGSFLLLWFPWASHNSPPYVTGLHLICALFLYDAFYSCVNVAWSALFSESTYDHSARVTAIKFSQLAILLSVNIIAVAEKISHSVENFFAFQCTCIVVAFLAMGCFWITGNMEKTEGIVSERAVLVPEEGEGKVSTALTMAKQVVKRQDFVALVLTNFIHNCRSVCHLNFAAMATATLIPETILPSGSWSKSLFFGACTLVPQLLVVASGNFIARRGSYRVIMASFILSISLAAMFWMLAAESPLLMMVFMFLDSVLVHSIAPLFQILVAEYVDDDAKRYSRRKPISSLIFSLNALLVKPAQSVTPVIVLYLLGEGQYENNGTAMERANGKSAMYAVVCLTPLLLGSAQFFIMRLYSLKNAHFIAEVARNV
uniref:Transmembrane protein 180 n=1 Tax=Parascaris univalens TaxID=6257 RepID=A0A915BGI2_PARUN